jgi:hypothetical protein
MSDQVQTDAKPARSRRFRVETYTSGEVAQILDVSQTFAIGLMNTGGMKGIYRVPGSTYRRIARLDLVEWMASRPECRHALVQLCGPLPPGWPEP